jgi:hypothetical protein
VCRVTVEPDWWRALRGVTQRGVWIPGAMCIGTRGHHGGKDFVAVRPGRPVVCIELWPRAPFSLLAVSVRHDAEATAWWLCRLARVRHDAHPSRAAARCPHHRAAPGHREGQAPPSDSTLLAAP